MESIIQFANSKRIKAGWIYIKGGFYPFGSELVSNSFDEFLNRDGVLSFS